MAAHAHRPVRADAPHRARARARSSARAHLGGTLLEVLVSVLIFSFGILGLVAMQVRATQFSVDAEDRNRAALLADDLAAQMRLARTVDPTRLTAQIAAWEDRVRDTTNQGLPSPQFAYDAPGDNTVTITITWQPPRATQPSRLVTRVVLSREEV